MLRIRRHGVFVVGMTLENAAKIQIMPIIVGGSCHGWRIPVTERTRAKISIPETLKSFPRVKSMKWLPDFAWRWAKIGPFTPSIIQMAWNSAAGAHTGGKRAFSLGTAFFVRSNAISAPTPSKWISKTPKSRN